MYRYFTRLKSRLAIHKGMAEGEALLPLPFAFTESLRSVPFQLCWEWSFATLPLPSP